MQPDEYRKMAEVEDAMWYYRSVHGHMRRCLEQQLGSQPARILDAGCGSGGLIKRLRAVHPEWSFTGLDFSPLACALARQRCPGEIVEGSVTALPFAAECFDAITSVDLLDQLDLPAAAVAEFHRCLRPGGVVVINVPAYPWMRSYHDVAVHSRHRFVRPEMRALLRDAGFHVSLATYWNTLPFPLAVLRRKVFPPSTATSDVRLYPAPVEAGFNALMALEHGWLGLGGRLPFGSSVLTVARKP
jgi:SAM-dependent methyltransferase